MGIPAFLTVDSTVCNILRLTPDLDHELGASPGEFEFIAIDVVCALDRTASISMIYGGVGREMSIQGETNQETYKLFLLPSQDIISGDKVIIGAVEYKVTDMVSFPTHRECMLSLAT